jgi:uncharacterized membrane protein YqjE
VLNPDPDASGGEAPGVVASLRRLATNAVGIIHTRLELLANDLEEERVRTLRIVVLGAIALFCAAVGLILVTAWVVVAFWEQHRLATLAILALVYFVASGVALWMLKARASERAKLFSTSLAELRRDRDLLNS